MQPSQADSGGKALTHVAIVRLPPKPTPWPAFSL